MRGRIALIVLLALLGVHVALVTLAQEEALEPVPRPQTLGERLQRFRRDIVGEEKPRERMPVRATIPRASRKLIGPAGASPAIVSDRVVESDPSQVQSMPRTEPVPQSSITVPPRMERQGARPARAAGRGPAPVDPATQSLRAKMVPFRRSQISGSEPEPVVEQGRPSMAPDREEVEEPMPEQREDGATVPRATRLHLAPQFDPTPAEAGEISSAGAPTEAADETPADEPIQSTPSEDAPGSEPAADEPAAGPHEAEPMHDLPEPTEAEPSTADESIPQAQEQEADSVDPSPEPPAVEDNAAPLEPEPADETPQADASEAPHEHHERHEQPADHDHAPTAAAGAGNVLFTAKSPVLSVEATGPRTVMVGKEAEFVVKLRNTGAAANHVVVSINVPNYADVASTKPSLGTARPAAASDRHEALEWTIERLEADSVQTLVLKVVPRKSSPLDLAMNYTFTPETSQTMVEVQEPKLAMNLAGPTDVLFGQTKIYKLSISNPGNGDAENVMVGLLPIGRSGEATGTHKIGTLKAGENKTLDIELTARQAGSITIKAHGFADGGLRAEAAEQVLVRRASLQVEIEAPRVKYAGTAGTYRVKVSNVGNAGAENARISALLPPEAKFIGASSGGRHEPREGRVDWTIGSLQPGGQRVFELQTELHAAGDNRLQFTAAADGDLTAAASSSTRVEAIADLKLEVRDPQGPIAVGEEAVYEVRIRNRGTKAAEGVDLAIFFSAGLEPASADGGEHQIGTGQVVFQPIAAIAPDDTAVFHVRARAETPGSHVFRAEVTCKSLETKLATEEATHFYGERKMAARDDEPHPAAVPGDEPASESQATGGEPTPAAPEESAGE